MKTTKLITVVALVALAFMASHATAQAQTTEGTPLVLPRPDSHFSGDVGRTYLDTAKPQFPQPVQPPRERRTSCSS